jgi:hypothetical protein
MATLVRVKSEQKVASSRNPFLESAIPAPFPRELLHVETKHVATEQDEPTEAGPSQILEVSEPAEGTLVRLACLLGLGTMC